MRRANDRRRGGLVLAVGLVLLGRAAQAEPARSPATPGASATASSGAGAQPVRSPGAAAPSATTSAAPGGQTTSGVVVPSAPSTTPPANGATATAGQTTSGVVTAPTPSTTPPVNATVRQPMTPVGDADAAAGPTTGEYVVSPGVPAAPAAAPGVPGSTATPATPEPTPVGRGVPPVLDRNPRARTRLSGAAILYGPPQGLGMVIEYLPHWVAGFGVGIGGTARLINNTVPLAAGTMHAEINLMPVPFLVTPLIGAGFGFTFGPLAEYLPGLAGRAPDRDQYIRLLPYLRFGVRVDLRRRWFLVGDVVLVPDNRIDQGSGLHPLPGLRIGFNLL